MNKEQLKEAIKKLKESGTPSTPSKAEKEEVVFRYPKRLRKSPKKQTLKKQTPKKDVIKNLDNFML
jgi:hypothetical protein